VAATLAAAIMTISRMAMFFGGGRRDDRNGNPIALLATIILAPIAAMLIQMAISRSRELRRRRRRRRDRRQPARPWSARSERSRAHRAPFRSMPTPRRRNMFIIKPFSVGGLTSLFSSHPPTERRIEALLALSR